MSTSLLKPGVQPHSYRAQSQSASSPLSHLERGLQAAQEGIKEAPLTTPLPMPLLGSENDRVSLRRQPSPTFGGDMSPAMMERALGIFSVFDRPVFKFSGQAMGLNVEDWMSRVLVVLGFYLPNTAGAFMTQQHPIETLWRNIITLLATIGFTILIKSKLDPLIFNHFMEKKLSPDEMSQKVQGMKDKGGVINRMKAFWNDSVVRGLVNPFRPEYKTDDVMKWINSAETKWSKFDNNIREGFFLKYKTLAEELVDKAEPQVKEKFSETLVNTGRLTGIFQKSPAKRLAEKMEALLKSDSVAESLKTKMKEELPHIKNSAKFLNRMSTLDLTKIAVLTLATMFIIGGFVMDIVFTFFAPLDKDFDPMNSKYAPKPGLIAIQKRLFPKQAEIVEKAYAKRAAKEKGLLADGRAPVGPPVPYTQLLGIRPKPLQPAGMAQGWNPNGSYGFNGLRFAGQADLEPGNPFSSKRARLDSVLAQAEEGRQ